MYTDDEILEAINLLVENYGFTKEEALELIEEATYMDDVEDSYKDLKKKHPVTAGALKGFVYGTTGPLGGFAYGVHKVRRAKREGKKVDKLTIAKKTAKGIGYGVLTPGVAMTVGSVADYIKSKPKKEKAKKEIKKIAKEKRCEK